jgi:hypothetical protein
MKDNIVDRFYDEMTFTIGGHAYYKESSRPDDNLSPQNTTIIKITLLFLTFVNYYKKYI